MESKLNNNDGKILSQQINVALEILMKERIEKSGKTFGVAIIEAMAMGIPVFGN